MQQSYLASIPFQGQPLYYLSEEEECFLVLCSVCRLLGLPTDSTPAQVSADKSFANYWVQRPVQLPGEEQAHLRHVLAVHYWIGWLPTIMLPTNNKTPKAFHNIIGSLVDLLFEHWLEKSAVSQVTFYFGPQPLGVDLASGTALYSAHDLSRIVGPRLNCFLTSPEAKTCLRTLKANLSGMKGRALSAVESKFWNHIIFRRQYDAAGKERVWLHGFVAYSFARWLGSATFLRWLYDLQTHLLLTRQALLLPDDEAKGYYLLQQAQALL